MMLEFSEYADFLGSLALIAVLASAYGAIRRQVAAGAGAEFVLGSLFGIVALLQMARPLEPFDGVLIDMRCVPVALAGAFLGWRGLAACLLIAVGTRFYIGGTGMVGGILAIGIAGAAGAAWHFWTRKQERRGLASGLLLAGLMSLHTLGAFALTTEAMIWFFQEAASPIIVLNMLAIPVLALILERERRLIRQEDRLRAAATSSPDNGLMYWAHFKRDLGLMMTAAPVGHVSGLLIIQLKYQSWLMRQWGDLVPDLVLGAMRLRLDSALNSVRLIGLTPDRRIILPLSQDELLRKDALIAEIRSRMEGDPFQLPGGVELNVSVKVETREAVTHSDMSKILTSLGEAKSNRAKAGFLPAVPLLSRRFRTTRQNPQTNSVAHLNEGEHDLLFEKAALLMATRAA